MNDHNHMNEKPKTLSGISNKVIFFCVALLGVAIIAITVFKVSPGSLLYIGLFLACPLMHILMMRDGGHKH